MQGLFEFLVSDFFVWIIAGYTALKAVEGIREQKTGQTVMSVVLGGAAYYFVKNPITVLAFLGNIVSKVFGG